MSDDAEVSRADRPAGPLAVPGGEGLPALITRTEQVYEAILEKIHSGELVPGTPLRQEDLAERLGVSRHPVQQAFLLLRDHGLLREHGRRGVEVAPLGEDVVQDMYGLGAVLDGYTARLAADRRSVPWLLDAERAVDAFESAVHAQQTELVVAADHTFRRLLTRAAGSAALIEASAGAWRSRPRTMHLVARSSTLPPWFSADLRAILASVRDGQGPEAERRATDHAHRTRMLVLEALR